MDDRFEKHAMAINNPKWKNCICRKNELYSRENDIRSEFARDYTRILHSSSYRRLKHKTQVFFYTKNDHVCTRIEHVAHVESVSFTIAKKLGLNTELTKAIATGHDLGHAPFGHQGEIVLNSILEKNKMENFWHEKNGLRVVDRLDLLEGTERIYTNLNLTYAVRDGIISHCGEIDENNLMPRNDFVDLEDIKKENRYQPYTWEACIVKVSDKIAYLGRDIEDALVLKFLTLDDKRELYTLAKKHNHNVVNTSVITHDFIIDIIHNSSLEKGICFSKNNLEFINAIKQFNYEKIYKNKRLDYFKEYSVLVINSIFKELFSYYDGRNTLISLQRNSSNNYLVSEFYDWILKYCNNVKNDISSIRLNKYKNDKPYSDFSDERTYVQSIIDFISGMSDNYAIKCFESIISF